LSEIIYFSTIFIISTFKKINSINEKISIGQLPITPRKLSNQHKQQKPIILEAKNFESLKPLKKESEPIPAKQKNQEKIIINIKFDSLSTSSLSASSSASSSLTSLTKAIANTENSGYCAVKTSTSTPLDLNETFTKPQNKDSELTNIASDSDEENVYNFIESKSESNESVVDMSQNCRGAVACSSSKMFCFEKESLINSSKTHQNKLIQKLAFI
jgi:hypothetical protein